MSCFPSNVDITVFMMNLIFSTFLLTILFSTRFIDARLPACKASGKVKGKKPPPDQCHEDNNDSFCCIEGRYYTTYKCSPAVTGRTKGVLYLNGFDNGEDGYQPSRCDHNYHSDDTPVVAVSTGWYSGGSRCMKNITISGNGRRAIAMVVDECDSSMGCDADHDFLPPCDNNIVGASKAVWKALGVPLQDWGELAITWSDA